MPPSPDSKITLAPENFEKRCLVSRNRPGGEYGKEHNLYEVVINIKTRGPEKKINIDKFVDKMIREQDKPESGDKNSPWSRRLQEASRGTRKTPGALEAQK
ncbi:hypothetical protein CRE_15080 [Caenorhabditis remanei]|uniref:Uncharacterized protein n=1 Tax=Caenorhabditis remanei TaxID=31234 RepID=E3NPW9_CAERE|nr:hypothetical protein CRE_15080 [Caenorhabditis remanei]